MALLFDIFKLPVISLSLILCSLFFLSFLIGVSDITHEQDIAALAAG
jgi:hypothetical protein